MLVAGQKGWLHRVKQRPPKSRKTWLATHSPNRLEPTFEKDLVCNNESTSFNTWRLKPFRSNGFHSGFIYDQMMFFYISPLNHIMLVLVNCYFKKKEKWPTSAFISTVTLNSISGAMYQSVQKFRVIKSLQGVHCQRNNSSWCPTWLNSSQKQGSVKQTIQQFNFITENIIHEEILSKV